MVARDDAAGKLEEFRVRHELAPHGCKHDCKCTSARETDGNRGVRTGGSELGVDSLAHDALETHARAHESDTHIGERIVPGRVVARVGRRALAALPDRKSSGHGEQRLEEGAEGEPPPRLRPHAVADAPEERTEDESEHRRQRLLVRQVERRVPVAWRALEQPRERDGELRQGEPPFRGARAGVRTCTVLPVWNAHHTKTAEKQTTSLEKGRSRRPR